MQKTDNISIYNLHTYISYICISKLMTVLLCAYNFIFRRFCSCSRIHVCVNVQCTLHCGYTWLVAPTLHSYFPYVAQWIAHCAIVADRCRRHRYSNIPNPNDDDMTVVDKLLSSTTTSTTHISVSQLEFFSLFFPHFSRPLQRPPPCCCCLSFIE